MCKYKLNGIRFLIALILVLPLFSNAQPSPESSRKTRISVEIDPATFLFGGYGIHLRLQAGADSRWLIGFGAYAMDMPDLLVDLNAKNKGQGWNVRLNQGYGLFGERYFNEVNRGWFVGAQLGLQEIKLENEFEPGSTKFTNLLAMAYGGYSWQPFDFPLYFKPWAGIGYLPNISGETHLGELDYQHSSLTSFATFHLGYTF